MNDRTGVWASNRTKWGRPKSYVFDATIGPTPEGLQMLPIDISKIHTLVFFFVTRNGNRKGLVRGGP